jgi:hypothetical protein
MRKLFFLPDFHAEDMQRAGREALVTFISQKIQSITTVGNALQVAAREPGHALGNRPTLVTLYSSALAGEFKPAAAG